MGLDITAYGKVTLVRAIEVKSYNEDEDAQSLADQNGHRYLCQDCDDRPPSDPGEHTEAIESFRARFRDAETSDAVAAIARELAKLPKGHPIRTGANAAYKAADARCKGELPPDAEPPAVQS